MLATTHRNDVMRHDGKIVALIEMIPGRVALLIENVAGSPASQGSGLGRQLIAHAERVAALMEHATVRLYTNKLFVRNIQLYLLLSYKIDRAKELRPGTVAVPMNKSMMRC